MPSYQGSCHCGKFSFIGLYHLSQDLLQSLTMLSLSGHQVVEDETLLSEIGIQVNRCRTGCKDDLPGLLITY